MFKFLRKHRTLLFVSLVAVMVSLPFFGVGTNYLISSPQDVVMKINGEKIKRNQFDKIYTQLLRSQSTQPTAEQRQQLQGQALNELIRITVYDQEARKFAVHVPDQELMYSIANTPAFQREGQFDPNTYERLLAQAADSSPGEFEKSRRKDMAAMKLNQLLATTVHVSDTDLNRALEIRLAIETDAKAKKELRENPETLREELRNEELNWVYQDWLSQVNANLKVNVTSENFRKTLASAPQ